LISTDSLLAGLIKNAKLLEVNVDSVDIEFGSTTEILSVSPNY
jgi:hypothetical protein